MLFACKEADRYYIENSTIPADASLTEAEQAEMEEFLYNIRMINNVLGHKFLEPLVSENVGATEITSQMLYIQATRGANATGMRTNEGFVVLKGSQGCRYCDAIVSQTNPYTSAETN